MSDPSVQWLCVNDHPMARGADWCGTCGEPPARPIRARDREGHLIGVGDRVSWCGQIFTIKAIGAPVDRPAARTLTLAGPYKTHELVFEEPLHVEGKIPETLVVDLVRAASHNVCRWCGGDCPRWGADACPLRPRQLPCGASEAK